MAVNPAERGTPFQTSPSDVVALTLPASTSELQFSESVLLMPSAVVFLKTPTGPWSVYSIPRADGWRDRLDAAQWLRSAMPHVHHAFRWP